MAVSRASAKTTAGALVLATAQTLAVATVDAYLALKYQLGDVDMAKYPHLQAFCKAVETAIGDKISNH